jgi:Rrf2 family transcriptional regulator, cysteine metabolism repressor
MALLSRKVDYALLILSYLRHRPEGGCARVIAGRFGLSRAFVANILKSLCQQGFVVSHRGVKGGYVLRPAAADLSLADLMDALDDRFQLAECNRAAPDDGCSLFPVCPVRQAVADVHARVRSVLADVTLAELFGPGCSTGDMRADEPSGRESLPLVRG